MKPLSRLRAACVVGTVLALVTGCNSTAADGPTTDPPATPTASASVVDPSTTSPTPSARTSPSPSVVDPSTPTSASLDPAAQEAADRAAIEAQWAKFWAVYVGIVRTPPEQRAAALDDVSVEPLKGRILKDASDFDMQGLDNYGDVLLNLYSIDFLENDNSALIRDCQDQSSFGSLFVETGKKRTVGVAHNHAQAGFIRGTDGVWRVQTLQYLEDVPC